MKLARLKSIKGVTEPSIYRYFDAINSENFEEAASLFSPQGALHPPFESPILGKEAIAAYLGTEARGMRLYPARGIVEELEENHTRVEINGKVETRVFGVNVAWQFILNPLREILHVQVKLLASPRELLSLRDSIEKL